MWINDKKLCTLKWGKAGEGANNAAALMALTVIAHKTDPITGISRATYDDMSVVTGLSRSKLSAGLDVLIDVLKVITPMEERSKYKLLNGGEPWKNWAKFPRKSMYASDRIHCFKDFHLRSVAELDALKLFFLFVARRGNDTNRANISFDRITEYSAVPRNRIKSAVSHLINCQLIRVESLASSADPERSANAYRIVGIDPRIHQGTTGRRDLSRSEGPEIQEFNGASSEEISL